MANDPICGMAVDERQPATTLYEGRSYYFCCGGCKSTFEEVAVGLP
jgi:YHS domain-containing protein